MTREIHSLVKLNTATLVQMLRGPGDLAGPGKLDCEKSLLYLLGVAEVVLRAMHHIESLVNAAEAGDLQNTPNIDGLSCMLADFERLNQLSEGSQPALLDFVQRLAFQS